MRLNLSKYFNTIRHLKPVQIYGRLWYKIYHPHPDLSPPPAIRPLTGRWQKPPEKKPAMLAPNRFRFLNEEHDLLSQSDWNHPAKAKLWLYNLHYFDDLSAVGALERLNWHRSLIIRWIAENPHGTGPGWEPYPLSLRIVNWIKWALAGNSFPKMSLESLAIQVRFLAKRMEFYLLGNHLLANAKALIFAGLFFEGGEAEEWFRKGIKVYTEQIDEQILADGGHFELSPMYHSIILEDILDLINLFQCYADVEVEQRQDSRLRGYDDEIISVVSRMIFWLKTMCHPDGQIALFNDAALGIAVEPSALYEYAERLGLSAFDAQPDKALSGKNDPVEILFYGKIKLTHLKESGYIRVEYGPVTAILDVAPIGPDYLPGHSHADTLSFELSLNNQRVIVDSGTSHYADGSERLKHRGTAAHNTVSINGKDSSEVWGSFRVARRAHPMNLEIKELSHNDVMVACSHDGYQRFDTSLIHRREWHFKENRISVSDFIEGPYEKAMSRFYFSNEIQVKKKNDSLFIINISGQQKLYCRIEKGAGHLIFTNYYPEFGKKISNQCLEVEISGNGSVVVFEIPYD